LRLFSAGGNAIGGIAFAARSAIDYFQLTLFIGTRQQSAAGGRETIKGGVLVPPSSIDYRHLILTSKSDPAACDQDFR
jgi:hypothetical protein